MPTAAEGKRKFHARFVGSTILENEVNNNNKSTSNNNDRNSRKQKRRIRHKQKENITFSESIDNHNDNNDNDDGDTKNQVDSLLTIEQLRPSSSSSSPLLQLAEQQIQAITAENTSAVHTTHAQHENTKAAGVKDIIGCTTYQNNASNAYDLHLDLSCLHHKNTCEGHVKTHRVDTLNHKVDDHKTKNTKHNYQNKHSEQNSSIAAIAANTFTKTSVADSTAESQNMKTNCNSSLLEHYNVSNNNNNNNSTEDNTNNHLVCSQQLNEETMPSLMRSSHGSVSTGPIITEAWARSVIKPGEEFLLHDRRYPRTWRKSNISDNTFNNKDNMINRRRELYTARTAAYEHEMRCQEILYKAAEEEELALLREEQRQKEYLENSEEEYYYNQKQNLHNLGVNTPRSEATSFDLEKNKSSKYDKNRNLSKMRCEQLLEPTRVVMPTHRKAKINNTHISRNSKENDKNNIVPQTSRLSQTQYVRSLLLNASSRKSTKRTTLESTRQPQQPPHSLNKKSSLLTTLSTTRHVKEENSFCDNNSSNREEHTKQPATLITLGNVERASQAIDISLNMEEQMPEHNILSNTPEKVVSEKEETHETKSNEFTPNVQLVNSIKPFDTTPSISPRPHSSTVIAMSTEVAPQAKQIRLIGDNCAQNEKLQLEPSKVSTNENDTDEEESLFSMQSYHCANEDESNDNYLLHSNKMEENKNANTNHIDNSMRMKSMEIKSHSVMSDDSRSNDHIFASQTSTSSDLLTKPCHNWQTTSKADSSQVYSARQLRTRKTPVFFSRPTYDDDTTLATNLNKSTIITNADNKVGNGGGSSSNMSNESVKIAFTPRYPSHPLRNLSEESVTSVNYKTHEYMQEKQEELECDNKYYDKAETRFGNKIECSNDNDKAFTSALSQEKALCQVTEVNATVLDDHVNANSEKVNKDVKTYQQNEMLETIAKETELLRRARSTLLFRYYDKVSHNSYNSARNSYYNKSNTSRSNEKQNKLLYLQQPPILASSILHVRSAGANLQFNKHKLTQPSMEYEPEQPQQTHKREEEAQNANSGSEAQGVRCDELSNKPIKQQELQTEQSLEKKKRPHRPNIALTSVNHLQSTVELESTLSSHARWNDAQQVKLFVNMDDRNNKDHVIQQKNNIDVMKSEEMKGKEAITNVFDGDETSSEQATEFQVDEESISLDTALIDLIADPLFLVVSDENHCRLLILNAEYMARNALIERCYHAKVNKDSNLTRETMGVDSLLCEEEQLYTDTIVNKQLTVELEKEPEPRKPTSRALEMTEEPRADINSSSQTLTLPLPQRQLPSNALQNSRTPSSATVKVEDSKSHATIATARLISEHQKNKKNKHCNQRTIASVHGNEAAKVVHLRQEQKQSGTDTTCHDTKNSNTKEEQITSTTTISSNVNIKQNKELQLNARKARKSLHVREQPKKESYINTSRSSAGVNVDKKKITINDYDYDNNCNSKLEKPSIHQTEKEAEQNLSKVEGELQLSETMEQKREENDVHVKQLVNEEPQPAYVDDEEEQSLEEHLEPDNTEAKEEAVSENSELRNENIAGKNSGDVNLVSTNVTSDSETKVSYVAEEKVSNNDKKELHETFLHNSKRHVFGKRQREPSLSQRSVSQSQTQEEEAAAILSTSHTPPPLPSPSNTFNKLAEVKLIVNAIMPSEKTGPIHSLSTSNIGYRSAVTSISSHFIPSSHVHQNVTHETAIHSVDDKSFIHEWNETTHTENKGESDKSVVQGANEPSISLSNVHEDELDAGVEVKEVEHQEFHISADHDEEKIHDNIVAIDVDAESDAIVEEEDLIHELKEHDELALAQTINEERLSTSANANMETCVEDVEKNETIIDEDKDDEVKDDEEIQISTEAVETFDSQETSHFTENVNANEIIDVDDDRNENTHTHNDVMKVELLEVPTSSFYENNINNNEKSNVDVNAINIANQLCSTCIDDRTSITTNRDNDTNDNDNVLGWKEANYDIDEEINDSINSVNNEDDMHTFNTHEKIKDYNNINNSDEVSIADQEDKDDNSAANDGVISNTINTDAFHQTINIDTLEPERSITTPSHNHELEKEEEEQREEEEELKQKEQLESIYELSENKESTQLLLEESEEKGRRENEAIIKSKECEEAVCKLVTLLLPSKFTTNEEEEETNAQCGVFATNIKDKHFHDECIEEIKEFILHRYYTTHASSASNRINNNTVCVASANNTKTEKMISCTISETKSFLLSQVLPDYFQSRSAYIRKLRKELLLDNPNKSSPCATPRAKTALTMNQIKENGHQSESTSSSLPAITAAIDSPSACSVVVGNQSVLLTVNNNDDDNEDNEATFTPDTVAEEEVDDPLDDGSFQQQNVQYVLDLFGNAMQSSSTFCTDKVISNQEMLPVNIAVRHLFDAPARSVSTRTTNESHERKNDAVNSPPYS